MGNEGHQNFTKERSMICLPLDELSTMEEVEKRVLELKKYVGIFKIGKELFTRFGPEIVKKVISLGCDVFLDLKYHDIPNTVKGAAYAASCLGVKMFTIHASGGKAMMEAALEGVALAVTDGHISEERKPLVLAVTVLTSIDDSALHTELNIPLSVKEQVIHLATVAYEAGIRGIVCSAGEVSFLKESFSDMFVVTPGIKHPRGSVGSDQKRVFTPSVALSSGSSCLVIGRAITGYDSSEKRIKAAQEVLDDINKAF